MRAAARRRPARAARASAAPAARGRARELRRAAASLSTSVTMRPMLVLGKDERSAAGYTRFPHAWQSGATRLSKLAAGARSRSRFARSEGLAWFLKQPTFEVTVMKRWARIGTLTACVALALGCDEQTEVQRQTRDLQEAQKNVARVTQELEGQLERAKADVARLEQKVALARQGLTDDVLENQKELQAALQAQERRVS